MAENKDSIFRKESLERLSSPERLDQLMQVVSPKDWIPLAALGGLVVIGLIWSIFGRIPITVTGRGVLIRPDRIVSFESPISGQLQSVNVKTGECIEKGYVLATIDPKELKLQLQLQRSKLAQLQTQEQYMRLIQQQRTETEKVAIASSKASLNQRLRDTQSLTPAFYEKGLNAIGQQRISLQQRLKDTLALAPILKDRLQKRQALLNAGAIAKDTVLQAEQEYKQGLQTGYEIKAQLKQLDVSETEAQQRYLGNLSSVGDLQAQLQELDTRSKRLKQEDLTEFNVRINQIQELNRAIAQLQTQVSENSQIVSPSSGCILEITATQGQFATPGTPIGTLNTGGKNTSIVAVSYFDLKDGKQIQPGMTIQITPDTTKRERFGGIVGKITSVSPLPVTKEGAASVIGNPDLVAKLMPSGGGEIEVRAEMAIDSSTFSGYRWSSSKGPKLNISAGTTTSVRVKVEEQAPITYLLPILRDFTGIN
ncbi:NHLP bacteriocin system secretion protein [Cylindrospermum sp. FACHB-282]|uniref:NHLP bacteriocin system secretion protein n=1 Tax=Cylindrospermum sp. FACHB-282 TaxID=2692794 RepID=UPI001683AEA9|nr:NHLP bacteriocin system secretion protein [Cylindrospermum sp. FACHB-282]MBD2385851.1 NHLP bacteriocin system secretion protein [Cylindrospermum sp. FACHB-282]